MSLLAGFKVAKMCPERGCVGVKKEDDFIYVKDTKNPEQAALVYDMNEWSIFIAGVKNGEFDYAE